mmetsp:Transcript_30009/g.71511  ORF Transcript_30009/g.71511 Transcript_30009/m.71511 type:complete len:268 (-) Transcript_30009:1127-1930(-)
MATTSSRRHPSVASVWPCRRQARRKKPSGMPDGRAPSPPAGASAVERNSTTRSPPGGTAARGSRGSSCGSSSPSPPAAWPPFCVVLGAADALPASAAAARCPFLDAAFRRFFFGAASCALVSVARTSGAGLHGPGGRHCFPLRRDTFQADGLCAFLASSSAMAAARCSSWPSFRWYNPSGSSGSKSSLGASWANEHPLALISMAAVVLPSSRRDRRLTPPRKPHGLSSTVSCSRRVNGLARRASARLAQALGPRKLELTSRHRKRSL